MFVKQNDIQSTIQHLRVISPQEEQEWLALSYDWQYVQQPAAETACINAQTYPNQTQLAIETNAYGGAIGGGSANRIGPGTYYAVVGGGSQNQVLNQLTANLTGLPVYAGPAEGTAIGNLTAQMLAANEFATLQQARQAIRKSFSVQKYMPAQQGDTP